MGPVKAFAAEILHAGGPVAVVEQHARHQCVEFDVQPVRMGGIDRQHALPRAVARMFVRGERGVAHAHRVGLHAAPVVRVGVILGQIEQPADRLADLVEGGMGALQQRAHQWNITQGRRGDGGFGVQPAVPAMPGRIHAEMAQRPVDRPVVAVLQLFEIAAHRVGAPGGVAGALGDVVPVGVVRIDGDHRVMGGAAAQRAGARVEDAVPLCHEFRVALLLHVIGIVPDEEVPAHGRVFAGKPMERRNVVVVRQPVQAGLCRVAAGQQAGITAGLQQQHAGPGFRQSRRDGAAAGARSDHDVIEACGSTHSLRSPVWRMSYRSAWTARFATALVTLLPAEAGHARLCCRHPQPVVDGRPAPAMASAGSPGGEDRTGRPQNVFRNSISASLSASGSDAPK